MSGEYMKLADLRPVLEPFGIDAVAFADWLDSPLSDYYAQQEAIDSIPPRSAETDWLAGLDVELVALAHRLRSTDIPPRADAMLSTAVLIGEGWGEVVERLRRDIAAARRMVGVAKVKIGRPAAATGLLADHKGRRSLPHRDRLLAAVYVRVLAAGVPAFDARKATAEVLVLARPHIPVPEDDRALERAISNGKKVSAVE